MLHQASGVVPRGLPAEASVPHDDRCVPFLCPLRFLLRTGPVSLPPSAPHPFSAILFCCRPAPVACLQPHKGSLLSDTHHFITCLSVCSCVARFLECYEDSLPRQQ
jgi:hypothetical protein